MQVAVLVRGHGNIVMGEVNNILGTLQVNLQGVDTTSQGLVKRDTIEG